MKYDDENDVWYVEIPRARNGYMISIKFGDQETECDLCERGIGCNRVTFRGGVWSTIMRTPIDESRLSTIDRMSLTL